MLVQAMFMDGTVRDALALASLNRLSSNVLSRPPSSRAMAPLSLCSLQFHGVQLIDALQYYADAWYERSRHAVRTHKFMVQEGQIPG